MSPQQEAPPTTTGRPRTVSDKVVAQIHAALLPILEEYGEPTGFVVCVPWEVGQADFPFGTIVTRRGEALDARATLAAVDQVRKMLGHLAGSFGGYVKSAGDVLDSLGREIHERRQQAAAAGAQGGAAGAPADGDAGAGPG